MLTPIDIQNRELKSKMGGGYDKKDVDDFLEEIRASYEALFRENQSLKEKITSLSEGIQYYKKMESNLQKALVLAEQTSSQTQAAAKSQANSVMTQANAQAEALSSKAKAEIESLRREAEAQAEITKARANRELEETRNHVRKLVQSYENYRLQFKKLAEAQIEMLDSESFSIFVPELDELMNEAPSADGVMDDPGIIPINIGSPAPFVAIPDEPTEPPRVEEVPVDTSSFSVPISSEGAFAATAEVESSVAVDIPSMDVPVAESMSVPIDFSSPTDVPQGMAPTMDIPMGGAPVEEPAASVSLDIGNMGAAPDLGMTQPISNPMMDVPGMTAPAQEPAFAQDAMQNDFMAGVDAAANNALMLGGNEPAPSNDLFVDSGSNDMLGTTQPITPVNDMMGGAGMNDMLGGAQPAAPANDLLGGAGMNDMLGGAQPAAPANDMLGGAGMNDMLGGAQPAAPANDLLGGAGMNDMLGGAQPAAPANDMLGGAGMNDMLGGAQPAAPGGMMDVSSFMDAPAAAPAPADNAGNNGIIADPMMDMGGMMDLPTSTPAPAAQPQDNIMDMNPFNFIDPE